MPSSRSMRFALFAMKKLSGPILRLRLRIIATISGPPARPSLSGVGMPGIATGMLPTITPRKMPRNAGRISGWSSAVSESPNSFAAAAMLSGVPTTSNLSANFTRISRRPVNLNPPRVTRLTVTPKRSLSASCWMLLPRILLFVTRIVLTAKFDFWSVMGVSCFSPIIFCKLSIASGIPTTCTKSWSSSVISPFGMLIT